MILRNPMCRLALSICRCPSCATAGCCLPNRTGLPQLLGELSSVSGLLGRKSNRVAPFQVILFFDWLSKPRLNFRSSIHRYLIVSRWYFDEQNLCAWRPFCDEVISSSLIDAEGAGEFVVPNVTILRTCAADDPCRVNSAAGDGQIDGLLQS